MVEQYVSIAPRELGGFRACAARIPGCVVIHKDPNFAAEMIREAIRAVNEEDKPVQLTVTIDPVTGEPIFTPTNLAN